LPFVAAPSVAAAPLPLVLKVKFPSMNFRRIQPRR
jgi:hypothetical protein